jgi:hypothetical protein
LILPRARLDEKATRVFCDVFLALEFHICSETPNELPCGYARTSNSQTELWHRPFRLAIIPELLILKFAPDNSPLHTIYRHFFQHH